VNFLLEHRLSKPRVEDSNPSERANSRAYTYFLSLSCRNEVRFCLWFQRAWL